MSLRLALLERCLPPWLRRRMLRDLAGLIAEASRVPPPILPRGATDGAVDAIGRFTRDLADRVGDAGPEGTAIRDRLYRNAREMGRTIRRQLGVKTPTEAARALHLLYDAAGVDIEVDLGREEMVVHRCGFSEVYTETTCRFIGALDAGLVDGVTGGTTLVFTERITEGADCCRARLVKSDAP